MYKCNKCGKLAKTQEERHELFHHTKKKNKNGTVYVYYYGACKKCRSGVESERSKRKRVQNKKDTNKPGAQR